MTHSPLLRTLVEPLAASPLGPAQLEQAIAHGFAAVLYHQVGAEGESRLRSTRTESTGSETGRTSKSLSGLAEMGLDSARPERKGGLDLPSTPLGRNGFLSVSTLGAGPRPNLPDQRLKQEALKISAFGLRTKRLLFRVLEAFAQVGIVPILLKGYGLASRIYPDPLVRPISDVDLLVAPHELERAEGALRPLGLTPKVESDDYYPEPYRHHLAYGGKLGLVELHFRPMTAFGVTWHGSELFPRAVSAELEGHAVRYLRPEDELVYLALHAANHMMQRLSWLYDLKLFLQRYPRLDWSEVVRVAKQESRLPALLFYALDAARRLFSAEVSLKALAQLRPSPMRVAVSRLVFSEEALLTSYLDSHKPVWALAKLLVANSRSSVLLFSLRRAGWEARKAVRERFPELVRS